MIGGALRIEGSVLAICFCWSVRRVQLRFGWRHFSLFPDAARRKRFDALLAFGALWRLALLTNLIRFLAVWTRN